MTKKLLTVATIAASMAMAASMAAADAPDSSGGHQDSPIRIMPIPDHAERMQKNMALNARKRAHNMTPKQRQKMRQRTHLRWKNANPAQKRYMLAKRRAIAKRLSPRQHKQSARQAQHAPNTRRR